MITLPLLFIAALYAALLIWVGRKLKTWPTCIAVLLVLLSPVIYGVGSYQYVHYQHEQDCAREGGLKVRIQPEKADRIRVGGADYYGGDYEANFLLRNFYPKLLVVEAWDGKFAGNGQKTGYFAYTPDPATTPLPKKDWKFIKTPLAAPTEGLYVLDRTEQLVNEIEKTTWSLSRNQQTYVTWTMFYHFWSRNGAMNIGWRCSYPDERTKDSQLTLLELILK